MKKQRKHYTPEEKVAILMRHLLEQVPISELCDKHGLKAQLQSRPPEQRHGYITPKAMLAGRQREIHAECDRKLVAAQKQKQICRQQALWGVGGGSSTPVCRRWRKTAQLHPAIAIYRIDEEASACVPYSNLSRFR